MKTALAQNSTLLYVDDEAEILQLAQELLGSHFQSIELASSGIEAIEKLSKTDFNVVVTDFKMPNGNGLELTDWMKINRPDIPILIMTGNSQDKEIQDAIKKGVIDILEKPIRPNILINRIENSLLLPFFIKTIAAAMALEMGEMKMQEFLCADYDSQMKTVYAYSELIKIRSQNRRKVS